MPFPPIIRVKLSSEAAGTISVTPVVVREMPPRDLIEEMLAFTGKDEQRIREILRRGTLVSGASRFRWPGWDAEPESVREMLATFPDPDPLLSFSSQRCIRAVLRGYHNALELPREVLMRRRLLHRRIFWEMLMNVAGSALPEYAGYSYRDRADCYLRQFTAGEVAMLRAAGSYIAYRPIRDQVRSAEFSKAELYVSRREISSARWGARRKP